MSYFKNIFNLKTVTHFLGRFIFFNRNKICFNTHIFNVFTDKAECFLFCRMFCL